MAEMEFGVLSRQCLDRRMATARELADAIAAWERERNAARTKIEWSFRVADATPETPLDLSFITSGGVH